MKNKTMTSAATSIAVGAVVGAAAYMMSNSNGNTANMKKMKKGADRAMRNAGIFIDTMSNMMR